MTNNSVTQNQELLFHYTKFDTAFFYILNKGCLRLNPVAFMNDIYETENRLNDFWKTADQEIRSFGNFEYLKENKIKILCFVQDGKIRGFDNQLMWSFYGDKYEGVCLIFDKNKLITLFETTFGDNGKKEPVSYKLKAPTKVRNNDKIVFKGVKGFEWTERNMIYNENSDQFWNVIKKEKRYNDLFFRKNKQWLGENEFRFLVFDKSKPEVIYFKTKDLFFEYKDALIGLILGPKFNDISKENLLRKSFEKHDVKIYKSKYKDCKIIPLRTGVPDYQEELDYRTAFQNSEKE